jgi:hypothetical protein
MESIIDTKELKGIPKIQKGFVFLCKPIIKGQSVYPKVYDNHVLNDGKFWWATDGHRMHKLDLDGFGDPGVYKVVKNAKTQVILQKVDNDAGEFPNPDCVWPDTKDTTRVLCYHGAISKAYSDIIRAMDNTLCLNFHFVEDVLCDDFMAFIPRNSNAGPITFQNGTKSAIIMPMR